MNALLLTALLGLPLAGLLFYHLLLPLLLRLLGSHLLRRSSTKRELILRQLPGGLSATARIAGFFHPYCNAGGGGERVLWAAIQAVQETHPHIMCVVYTGDHDASKADILARVADRFSIPLDARRIVFLYLTTRSWVAASSWPRFTLAGQSLGSLVLAYDAFSLLVPDAFVDTMGYAFTLPLAKALFAIPTAAYVHYPTISTDMLAALPASAAASASLRTRAKRAYWRLFARCYSRCGRSVDAVMVNSTWTQRHIAALWPASNPTIVFPPCAVAELLAAPRAARTKDILCIAQFRPEKNHPLLLRSFARFHKSTAAQKDARLVLVGSVRHSEDATRVYTLRLLARELGIDGCVDFVCDAPWDDVKARLARASVGVNAMWNEHFGIGVVEYQAAGLVSVVHRSGGPRWDIVREGETGWWAESEEEFAEGYEKVLGLEEGVREGMREKARVSAGRFGEEVFRSAWGEVFAGLVEAMG
ncbi:hypothetical protein EDC01DRAFT_208730 [Geopyxis carbonaria]|nr:hypothetical protein EDC01DRAFT_208730 [Geopyxis carbonaria]